MFKSLLLGTVLALICCTAPIVHADQLDDVASTALHSVEPRSKYTGMEFGGAIYELNGQLVATAPETGNGHEVTLHIRIPHGAHLVALYHTHPGSQSSNEDFSEADISVAKQLKVPSYILATRSGTIHRFPETILASN
jgi:Domain of unknown function (DUF4329)/Prokaryotic homologs of the JAB domain